ncbi:hypothetical protein Tco_0613526 [Tanacetum coccineum]
MVACLERTDGNADFHEIVDFLTTSPIHYALTISLVEPFNDIYKTPVHTKKVFTNMKRKGKDFSGRITPLFASMLAPPVVEGEGSGQPTEPQLAPSTTQPIIEEQIPVTESSSPQNTQTPRQALQEGTQLPQTSVPIPNVADEAVFTEKLVQVIDPGVNTPGSDEERFEQHELTDNIPPTPHDSPLPGGHTLGSDEGRLQQEKLMNIVTALSQKVEGLESDLKKTKKLYATAFKKLINRVKSLEDDLKFQKSKSKRRRLTLVTSKDEEDLVAEDPFKHGRSLIEEMDLDDGISLVSSTFSTAAQVSTASTFVSTASPQRNADTTADDLTLAETLMEIRKSAAKDKGKAKMDETESPRKMKQRERVQISRDEEVAQKLQEEFDAAERQRMAQVHQAAQGFTDAEWDDVLARVVADEDFVQQLQAGEKCSEEDLPMKLVELVNQRKKFFAQQRAEAKRNKPMTPAQQKDYMSNYIKNQEGGYSIKQLKSLSFEQVKDIFETTMRRVQSFVPMGSELEVQRLKRAGSGEEQSAEKEKELSEEELQKLLVIVPVEELVIQPLQVRYPIIDWEVYSEDTRRDDLVKLWDLVKERFSTTEPTDDKEKELWVELKRLFEPDNDDILWKLQRYMHDPLVWRLYDTCGVHHVSSVRGHDIFMLVEKEYPLTRETLGLMMVARLLVEADSEMSRELLRKIFYQANRPRQ